MDRVSYKVSELLPLSLEQEANLQRLAALSDDDINLYDIPEVTDWSGATRHSMVSSDQTIIARFQDKSKKTGGN